MNYFKLRMMDGKHYDDYELPQYLLPMLTLWKDLDILDIGCGFGQMLSALKDEGFSSLRGIDVDEGAVASCVEKGLNVEKIVNLEEYSKESVRQYDVVIMSHVLEHIEKDKIIETLQLIKKKLLRNSGQLLVMVPNAQSNTGCYWAYEDFTHKTLFTSGSLYYVLMAAGFDSVEFIDSDGLAGSRSYLKKTIRKFLLSLYKANYYLWNRVTDSSFHRPSPKIFSYEIKAIAK